MKTLRAVSAWSVDSRRVRFSGGSILRCSVTFVFALSLLGCASLPAGAGRDPRDPFERYNRAMWAFNDSVDRALLRPAAQAYEFIVPALLRDSISNVFGNLTDFVSAANHLLQGKFTQAGIHLARFGINSTWGVLGVGDLATPLGLERQREDFGQTLGYWGIPDGPYLVLPLIGPSSARDTVGWAVDFQTDPVFYALDTGPLSGLTSLRVIHTRAFFLGTEGTLAGIALDRYVLVRDAYLARRRNLVYDGDPPDRIDMDGDDTGPAPAVRR